MLSKLLGLDRRSLLDNPSVSLSDPASFDYLTNNVATDTGINVSPKSALRLPPVWQAVTMISGSIAAIPLDIFENDAAAGRVVNKKHPAHRLVRRRASKNVTALELWQTVMVHALIWNNGYIFIDRLNDGTPIGLYNLLPDRTHPEIIKGEWYFLTETVKRDGTPWLRPLAAEDVIHVKGISLDGIIALDTVESAKHSWANMIARQKFESKFFKHGVRAGGILELPVTMKPAVRDKVEEGFKKQSGEDNWFRTVILRDGAKFHQQTFDPQSAQMAELGESAVRDVARWFNLAPSKLGLSDSVSYNSKSEDNKSYLDTTLSIWLEKIASQCNLRLLTENEQVSGAHYFEHNTAAFLRMNLTERYQAYSLGFGRWLNRNNIREMENLPSTGPEGDKFTAIPVVSDNPAGGNDKKGNDKPRGPGKRTGPRRRVNPDATAIRRCVFTLADHARKKSTNPKAFIEFVDSNLSFHRQRNAGTPTVEPWIDRAADALRKIAETTPAAQLEDAVNTAMAELETACP